MKTSKLAKVIGALSLLATVVVAGCDTEAPPMPDETAAIVEDEDPDAQDDDDDDGDDGGDDGHVIVALAAPTQPQSGLHPCGNAVLDDGEECDDGLANGNDRECTYACTLNDCDLDEHGYCEDHWPAADVDLYPCANTGTQTACDVGLAGQ
jgi:hypothetical protein